MGKTLLLSESYNNAMQFLEFLAGSSNEPWMHNTIFNSNLSHTSNFFVWSMHKKLSLLVYTHFIHVTLCLRHNAECYFKTAKLL